MRSECDFKTEWYSGSGAGGQHRNKHCNSARIRHVPTGIVRTAQTRKRESSYREAMAALVSELDRMAAAHGASMANGTRQRQIGAGMRSDKRRTYRFREDRVVDHVTGRETRCADVMNGFFDALWR